MTSSSTTPPSSPPMSPRDIVAPLTPTRSSSPTTTTTTSSLLPRIPSDLHDAQSDLDPTEWKPVIHRYPSQGGGRRTPSSTSLSSSSEAWTFLSQFHHHHHHHHHDSVTTGFGLRRSTANTHRSSAVSLLSSTLAPSLTNTSTSTMASSLSSNNSAGSPLEYNTTTFGGHDAGATRPLPPRHNPSYTGVSATKGVELVVPHIAAAAATPTTTTTATAGTSAGAGESLASSPTDSHDGGVWLKSHRHRHSTPVLPVPTTVASGASFATAVLVEETH